MHWLRRLALNRFTLGPLAWLSHHPGLRRRTLAYAHLRGTGIEIGALHNPMPVPPGTRVRYVDRMPEVDLLDEYRAHRDVPKASVDLVEDAHELFSIADGSQDFLIASHIIEHMENPLLALKNWLRVLRPGGMLYLAVPNRDLTFDRGRPVTPFAHLLQDYERGPEHSRADHYLEWARCVGRRSDEDAQARLPKLLEKRPSIHFHVWDPPALLDFLQRVRTESGLPLGVLVFEVSGNEVLVLCKKTLTI